MLLLLALACASAVPVRPSLHGLGPLLPAIARTRRRGPAPLASAQASRPAGSGKREVIDTATQLAASIATGQLAQAMHLKAMHDLPLNEEEYASLISLAGAADDWQLAVSLLRERDEQGLGLSAPTHLAALWACARAAEWRVALDLLEEMELYGLPSAPSAFTAACSACRAAGEWEEAVALVRRACARGVQCDGFLYMHAIDACEEAGQRTEAMEPYPSPLTPYPYPYPYP